MDGVECFGAEKWTLEWAKKGQGVDVYVVKKELYASSILRNFNTVQIFWSAR